MNEVTGNPKFEYLCKNNELIKKSIHFNLLKTVNYADVQKQISEFIAARLKQDGLFVTQSDTSVENLCNISFFIREPAEIYIGHNLADKNYLLQRNKQGEAYINQFQHVFVPGYWMKERLLKSRHCHLEPYQIHLIGSPRVDYLRQLASQQSSKTSTRRTILWAPVHDKWTYKDQVLGSYPSLQAYLEDPLIGDNPYLDIITSLHPRNRKDKYAVTNDLIDADIVISDYSSVVFEAWALGKPVVFPRWLLADIVLDKAPNSAEAYIFRERIGYHADSFESLISLLESEELVVDKAVDTFMHEYLHNYEESNSLNALSKVLQTINKSNYLETQQEHYKKLKLSVDEKRWQDAKDYIYLISEMNDEIFNSDNKYINSRWVYILRSEYKAAAIEKRWRAAEEALSELIIYEPNNAENYNLLGQACRKQGKWGEEAKAFEKALKLDKYQATWWYRLGEAYEVVGDFNKSSEAYQNAVSLKAGLAEWYYRLGSSIQRIIPQTAQRSEESRKAYAEAIKLDNQHNSKILGIGVFHQKSGRWQEARKAYEQQLEQSPLNSKLLYAAAMASDCCGDWSTAEQFYIGAISTNFEQPYWHFRLGLMYEHQQKFEDAATAYQFAAQLRSKHTPYWYYACGKMHQLSGNYKEASEAYLNIRKENYKNLENQNSDIVHKSQKSFEADNMDEHKLVSQSYLDKFDYQNFIIKQLAQKSTISYRPDWLLALGKAYEAKDYNLKAAEVYASIVDKNLNPNNADFYRAGLAYRNIEFYEKSLEYFSRLNFLDGFKRRVKKEVPVEVVKFEFDGEGYLFGVNVHNKSKINHSIKVSSLFLKHRLRIGNEVDELQLKVLLKTSFVNFDYFEFYFNPNDFFVRLHYWDIFIQLDILDNVYGNVVLNLPCNNFSKSVIEKVDQNPWEMAVKDGEFILHPYKTVGGKKIALLKRPLTEYDDVIYYKREQQAISEYLSNKKELDSKKAWLIFEKYSKTAQDNGFHFFKYAVQHRSNVYYVIEKSSPDRKFLDGYEDNVIEFMSIAHMKLLLSCEMIISSEGRGHGYAWRRISGLFKQKLLNTKYFFLQHGVIGLKKLGNDFSKNNKNFAADFFIASTQNEKEIINKEFGYTSRNTILSGLPRWTVLKDLSSQYEEIFLMPTWRNWLEDIPTKEFVQTEYFRTYKKLLTSSKLFQFLESKSIVLNFYLHPKVIGLLNSFIDDNPRINFVNFGDVTISDLLQRSKLLITDYSSVAWDFIYLEKPVVFYHFDIDKYEKLQGAYLDLKENALGQSFYNEESLISGVADIISNYSHYKKRALAIKENCFYYQPENINEYIYHKLIAQD